MMMIQEREKIKKILKNHRLYATNFLKIKTKAGELKPLVYNKPQEELDRIWQNQAEQGKPVRLLVLKARQEGISTYTQSRGYHQAATKRNQNIKIVAHEDESTDNLFKMAKTFHENVPQVVEGKEDTYQIRPKEKYSNRKELIFESTGSQITMKTAGKDTQTSGSGVGRSQTIHFLHGSEVAFWSAAKQTLTALLQTVPDLPDTVVVLESTANGVGDYFYTLWDKAKKGEIDFIPVFLPWFIHDEYEIPLEPGESLEPYDDEESSLKERFNLSDAKLKWRRQTIKSKCQGDVEQFHQEYPSDDQEAFIVSGRPFFDQTKILEIKTKHQKPPIKRGYLEWVNPDDKRGDVTFIEDPKGYISIWSEPKPLGCYCIGADVAEGLEKGDYSTCDVLDRDTFEQAAQWHGHIDPDMFGEELVKLAIYYNRCWIGPEINNHGLTTAKAIVRLRYPRLYMRKTLDEREPDLTDKLGWRTDTQTRPIMLDDYKKAMRDGLIIHSERTISECLTFVRNSKGKPEAQGDCYDDTVLAGAITIQMHKLCPMTRPKMEDVNPLEHRNDYHSRRKRKPGREVTSEATGY
jgi:hypothetical protein